MVTDGQPRFSDRASDLKAVGTPLRDFWARIGSFETASKVANSGGQPYIDVAINFLDLKVIESKTPWPFPAAKVDMRYSDRENSQWGTLLKGLERHSLPSLTDAVNSKKYMHFKVTERSYTDRQQQARTTLNWDVVEVGVNGQAGAVEDEVEHLLKLADGKTETEFNSAALLDAVARQRAAAIMDGSLIASFMAAGKLKKEGDRLKKV